VGHDDLDFDFFYFFFAAPFFGLSRSHSRVFFDRLRRRRRLYVFIKRHKTHVAQQKKGKKKKGKEGIRTYE
jgi:hypothetical protein